MASMAAMAANGACAGPRLALSTPRCNGTSYSDAFSHMCRPAALGTGQRLRSRPFLVRFRVTTFRSRRSGAVRTSAAGVRAEDVREAVLESQVGDETDADEEEDLEPVDPEFYRIGYMRYVRAYGVEFKEGPKGIGVYAAKDMKVGNSARVIIEVPMELMVTVSKELPWMFFPDIVPIGHPIFEIINSTDPETDWDLRLACLLLLALDQNDNFWQDYSDYLPGQEDITSLLLASEEELKELHNKELERVISAQKQRAFDFWKMHWEDANPILKVKRLARDPSQFVWALAIVWSRKFLMTMTIGAKVQDAHMLIPYADMLNHSFQPTCSYRWRKKDRMLEVVMNPAQSIRRGEEMTLNYGHSRPSDMFLQFYGFSSPENPFEVVPFSGNSRIHRDSFLSAFNLFGMTDDIYYEGPEEDVDGFVDGAVMAATRTLPTWTDDTDFPFLPSQEIRAAKELKTECQKILESFPTTLEEDLDILSNSSTERSPRWQAAVRYRMHRKSLIRKMMQALDLYVERILF